MIVAGLLWGRLERIEDGGYERIAYWGINSAAWLGLVFFFPRLGKRASFALLLVAAILVRVAYLGAPVTNDAYRYLWEGKLLLEGENPYAHIADHEDWEHLRDENWYWMNNRGRMTAYPPGVELIMAAASAIHYGLMTSKVVALVAELVILFLLFRLIKLRRRPLKWIGWFAFNPLVIGSFAAEGHFDSWMVAGILAALLAYEKGKLSWVWFWLGFAFQMKVIAVLLCPLIFLRVLSLENWREDWRKLLRGTWPFFLWLVVPSLFFITEIGGVLYGLAAFGGEGAFNGGLYEAFRFTGLGDKGARAICFGLFGLGFAYLAWRELKGWAGSFLDTAYSALLLLLICSPVVHFWYLTWVAWFLVLRPQASLIALCMGMGVYFLSWENSLTDWGWGYSRETTIWMWVPWFLLFSWEKRNLWSQLRAPAAAKASSLSVVVPYVGKLEVLQEFLSRLQLAVGSDAEIIVAGTEEVTAYEDKLVGVQVVKAEKGRGQQIAAGTAAATGDLIAIVHADSGPQKEDIDVLFEVAELEPFTPAFCFGQRFPSAGGGLTLIEFLNEARATLGGSIFGDQTLVIRRESFAEIGGFPAQPLMEDVEVSIRLQERGEILYLGCEWDISAEKWHSRFKKRFSLVVSVLARYHWHRLRGRKAGALFSKKLYEDYYGASRK